ncbi:MAG: flavin reductase family protein [Herpetosiphonaceae bacterium]|nr:flavin reductase family protein [Herpetosiphonaceae bacterium]
MGIDEAEFRQVLGHFASGVTVVTMQAHGQLHGLTVSAFASLSLDPPLILVCIDRHYPSHEFLQQAGTFAVNILREDGERLSRHFASRVEDKFAGVAYHQGVTGAPLLDEALATLECKHTTTLPGGDHSIFIGEVIATATHEGNPLLYYRSGYGKQF